MISARATASRSIGTTVRRVRRAGMRGGLAYVDIPISPSTSAGQRPLHRAAVYWSGAGVCAATLYVLLVGRATEFLPFAAAIRPVALACVLALCAHIWRTPQATWRAAIRHPQFVRSVLYVALAAITVPFALWPGGSAAFITPLTYGLVLVLVFLLAPPDKETFDRVINTILIGTGFCIAAIVATGAVVEGTRLSSTGSYDANDLAAFSDVLFLLALGRAMRGKAIGRVFFLALAVLFVAVTLRTASRGGAIALAVGALVLLAGLNGRRIMIGLLVAMLATPVAWRLAPDTFRERAATIISPDEDYNATSTSGRTYIWRRGLVFFVHRPIIGVGPGNFETRLGQDFGDQGAVGAWHTAHNTVIQVFVELGVFGGALLLTMVGSVIKAVSRFWRRPASHASAALARAGLHRPELLAATIAYVTAALFLSHAYSYLTFGIIALGTYAGRVWRHTELVG